MASLYLDEDEIVGVTGKKRPSAQHRALNEMGLTHKIRPDGSILLSRSHYEAQLGGDSPTPKKKKPGPNWDAMNA